MRSYDTNKPTILIVEDNPSDLRLLSSLIEDQAHIIFSTTGDHGVTQALKHIPDLILLDVELPDLGGFDVCMKIKAESDTKLIPIIFVTGHSSPDYEIAALEAGAIDFITKPFNPPIISARVKTHLTLKKQSDILLHLSEKDGLTNVYNRRYFDAKANEEWKRHMRQKQPLGIAMVDVDHFKQFNDCYGHTQGDECLKSIASKLDSATRRPGEFVARYGGEEFVCLLPNSSPEETKNFGNYICDQISELALSHAKSDTQKVTISVGTTSATPSTSETLTDLLNRADKALYKAKESGRNRCSQGV